MEKSKLRIILASASPRRRELLGHLDIAFEILAVNIDEISKEIIPSKIALDIAKQKGEACLKLLSGRTSTKYSNHFI